MTAVVRRRRSRVDLSNSAGLWTRFYSSHTVRKRYQSESGVDWSAEDIVEFNPAQPGQTRSKLDRYLSTAQINLSLAAEAATEIGSRDQHHVAAFFQLPFPVNVEPSWHAVPTATHGLRAELKFDLCRIKLSASNEFELLRYTEESDAEWPMVTQITAPFQVWGARARFHEKYLTNIGLAKPHNPIIVPQVDSWIDNRPISLRDYGFNLSGRLLREVVPLLRCVLPAYSIVALREAPVPNRALGYHAMISPGRLTFAGEAISAISASLATTPIPVIQRHLDLPRRRPLVNPVGMM